MASRSKLSLRYWIELACAVVSAVLFILTIVFPEWIEAVFGIDPDGGNGLLEIGIAVAFLAVAVTSSFLARKEWRPVLA